MLEFIAGFLIAWIIHDVFFPAYKDDDDDTDEDDWNYR